MQRDDPVSGDSDIVSFDLRTKADFVLTAGFPGQNTHPSVAPDGCLVVFAHADNTTDNADLYTISITGGTPDQVTDTPEISEVQPVWSPLDSIVYAVPDGDLFVTDEFGDVNVDLGVEGDSPQTSPDGQWVLFTLTDTPTDQIAVVSILGRAHGFYDLEVQGDHPHWSANGQAIFIQAGGGIVGFEFGKPPTLIKAGATDISVNPGGNGAVLVVDGQLWLFRTLDQSDSPQQLTQPGGHKLTNSAPEWWNPNPATADMRPFLHYLQGVAPVS